MIYISDLLLLLLLLCTHKDISDTKQSYLLGYNIM
jgi:hypothetical protein